ncbi:MAG: reverse transcriptase domain-containing protein [Chloroflexota bacterium]
MSDEQPRTREELYQRIRATSRTEFILEEMIRLGFWPADDEMPENPAGELRRQAQLSKELAKLRAEHRKLYNEAALIREARKRRLAESRQKRKETKARRLQERQARAEAWQRKKAEEIVYLGEGVSAGLNHTDCDLERLVEHGLPPYNTAQEIAQAMDISVGELRFLAFARQTSKTSHYVRFAIPKKRGGQRFISAPMPRLKTAQYWILDNVLQKITLHDAAHGFRTERSIVTNAAPHLGAEVVINMDLKDFFPTISYKRVKGLFRSLGYSEAAATIFGLICTEPEVAEVELDGETYFVATSERRLPQGAPTSPAISNIICRRLDRRLTSMAADAGFTYTRYADDLTFSASGEALRNICNIFRRSEAIIVHEGFTIHPDKTRVLRQSSQQEVTGLVVNNQLNVPRKTLKQFRATLYQIEKDGPEGKRWGQSPDVIASILGFANFVYMVNPEKGAKYQAQVSRIIKKHGWQPAKVERTKPKVPPSVTEPEETSPEPPQKKWWQFWSS